MTTTSADAADAADAIGRGAWGTAWRPTVRADAPGRIELLGNHLDYNGGRVLAAAIDRGITILAAPAGRDGVIDIAFRDPHSGDTVTDAVAVAELGEWQRDQPPGSPTDYLRGAVAALVASRRPAPTGARLAIAGDLPVGLGLSSSAALSVALLGALHGDRLPDRDWILMAQSAENRAGVACGTMDQAASVSGGVIRYDAAAVSAEVIEPDLGDHAFVVVSSGVTHRLGESAYPVRVREMGALLAIARDVLGDDAPGNVAGLTEAAIRRIDAASRLSQSLGARARHVLGEVTRVDDGYDALRRRDWAAFGQLMTASGRSSATDYDVSHPQVEELVAEMLEADGVLGARMMGGGGGGSVLALVQRSATGAVADALDRGYFARHGLGDLGDRFLTCAFAPGASVASGRFDRR